MGSEKDGVGITTLKGQPQQTMGRSDLTHPTQASATDYEAIRDRIAGKLAPQMMPTNAGGVGVQGNVYANMVYINNQQAATLGDAMAMAIALG